MSRDESATCPHCQAIRRAEEHRIIEGAGLGEHAPRTHEWPTSAREWVFLGIMAAIALVCATLICAPVHSAEPASLSRWHYSDRLYKRDNRTPYSFEQSQPELARLALQAGYAGPDGNGPGYQDTVIGLDGERAQAGRVRFLIAPPADTLWKALLMPDKWLPGECSYVAVVRGGAAPDSILVVLTNGTQFTERIERKRK